MLTGFRHDHMGDDAPWLTDAIAQGKMEVMLTFTPTGCSNWSCC